MRTRRTLLVLIAVVAAITTTSAWTVTVAAPGHHDDGHSHQEQKSKKDKDKNKKKKRDRKAKEQAQVSAPAGVLGTKAAPRDIAVTMTDTLRFDPGTIAVHEGETIRFLLENPTVAPHDFTLGDMDAQMHHHEEMSAGMGHEHGGEGANGMPGAVSLQPGESAEVIATFDEPGEVLIGCHIPGHWEAGMRGALLVMPGGEPKGA